jgi:hypothetical protein
MPHRAKGPALYQRFDDGAETQRFFQRGVEMSRSTPEDGHAR